jgi:hypothetical protein
VAQTGLALPDCARTHTRPVTTLIRARRLALGTAMVVLAACGSSGPDVITVTPSSSSGGVTDLAAALNQSLAVLKSCVSGADGQSETTTAVCYDGLAYSLDSVTWPPAAQTPILQLQASAHAAASCLSQGGDCHGGTGAVQTIAAAALRALSIPPSP